MMKHPSNGDSYQVCDVYDARVPVVQKIFADMNSHFSIWKRRSAASLSALEAGCQPKGIISALAEDLLTHYRVEESKVKGQDPTFDLRLSTLDAYAIYQHLMDYWAQTMQDDCYLIAADGWKAETARIIETDKKGKERDKGWTCDLIPKPLIVARYFAKEQAEIETLTAELEAVTARLAEMEEEHGGEDGAFSDLEKVNRGSVSSRVKEIKVISDQSSVDSELAALEEWLKLNGEEGELKKKLKDAEADLDAKAYAHYPKLTEAEIKTLVVDDKWLAVLEAVIHGEMERVSQSLTQRVKELAERYETPVLQLNSRVNELEAKVNRHLEKMGFSWK
jgi:type I restriction enzyme M protein